MLKKDIINYIKYYKFKIKKIRKLNDNKIFL